MHRHWKPPPLKNKNGTKKNKRQYSTSLRTASHLLSRSKRYPNTTGYSLTPNAIAKEMYETSRSHLLSLSYKSRKINTNNRENPR